MSILSTLSTLSTFGKGGAKPTQEGFGDWSPIGAKPTQEGFGVSPSGAKPTREGFGDWSPMDRSPRLYDDILDGVHHLKLHNVPNMGLYLAKH